MTDFVTPSAPGGGGNLPPWAELNGALLVVTPKETTNVTTSYGPTDALRASVLVVDGKYAGVSDDDALIFPKVLQSQLSGHIGKRVLGRVMQGTAKPGQSPPWMLDTDPTDADRAAATAALNASFSAPAQPVAPPPVF